MPCSVLRRTILIFIYLNRVKSEAYLSKFNCVIVHVTIKQISQHQIDINSLFFLHESYARRLCIDIINFFCTASLWLDIYIVQGPRGTHVYKNYKVPVLCVVGNTADTPNLPGLLPC